MESKLKAYNKQIKTKQKLSNKKKVKDKVIQEQKMCQDLEEKKVIKIRQKLSVTQEAVLSINFL